MFSIGTKSCVKLDTLFYGDAGSSITLIMNEAQRQYCLEQMGIQTWYSRYPLPAAAPSVLQLRPVSHSELKPSDANALPGSGRADAVIRQLDKARATKPDVSAGPDSQASPVPPSEQSPAVKSTPAAEARQSSNERQVAPVEVVRCKLALSVIEGNILVLNQLPAAGNGQLAVPHQHLLARIGQYLENGGSERKITSIHPFRWPLLDLPDVDNSINAMRSALLAFIEGHAESSVSTLVLMGNILTEQVFPLNDDGRQRQGLENQSCRIVVTYSLDQLIKMPELKRECWLALRNSGKP